MGKNSQGRKNSRNNYSDFNDEGPAKNGAESLVVKKVKYRNTAQSVAMDVMNEYQLSFLLGKAGTAKTFLAVYNALVSLQTGDVQKILLVRPAVQAGEDLGFLPGSLEEKLDPYMRPLLDNIQDLIGIEACKELIQKEIIQFIPLGYMRGRTFKNAYIVLDEMQNATSMQLRLALTRIGDGSVCVVTADKTQIDLADKSTSCIGDIEGLFKGNPNIGYHEFTNKDIVRSEVVKLVLSVYDKGGKVGF